MSTGAIPGGGQDGQQPPGPARDGGFCWDDEDAYMEALIAAADAAGGRLSGEGVQGAWFSLAGVADPAELDLGGLAEGGPIDTMVPDAALAALAAEACDPAVLPALADGQVLGLAAAGRRLAGRAAWIQQAAAAEFAARRLEPDRKKATAAGFTPFAADELAPELVITANAAELQMAAARDASRRLPVNSALLRDGMISAFQLKIITDATQCLSDAGAAEADVLLAAAAPGLTPGMLRAMCTRVVMMIDPQAAQRRKDGAAKQARVVRFQEYSGTAALCGRDLPPEDVLASSQHIDAIARALRAAGIPGTLQQLRATAFLDLTQGHDPLDRLVGPDQADGARAGTGEGPVPGGDAGDPRDTARHGHDDARQDDARRDDRAAQDHCADRDDSDRDDDEHDGHAEQDNWDEQDDEDQDGDQDEDGEDDDEGSGGPGDGGPRGGDDSRPGGPSGPGSRTRSRAKAPVKAVINLLVPAGTLLGWSSAPGEIPGFGLLDPQTTRDMVEAASAHQETRWCVTVVGADGTAEAHGCAPGRHPWTPGLDTTGPNPHWTRGGDRAGSRSARDSPGSARDGMPEPGTGGEEAQVAGLLRQLRVKLAPIAKGECDHRHYSDKYVISRMVKHLIRARAAKCTAPGCNRPAAEADADHTIPWPEGPSCECNIGAPCRYHHRNKQAPGWRLEQPQPGVMKWRNPSGRTHTTYPTKYMI